MLGTQHDRTANRRATRISSSLKEVTMTRILVAREDGCVIWNEGVNATDFETEHFRRALADRLGWAVADADANAVGPTFAAMHAFDTTPASAAPRTLAGAI
jgi:hypothetical protein